MSQCLSKAKEWHSSFAAVATSGVGNDGASAIEVIVGGNEPICRMALVTYLTLLGNDENDIMECETPDETLETMKYALANAPNMPLMVILSTNSWVGKLADEVKKTRTSFFVSADPSPAAVGEGNFHASLPSQSMAGLQEVINECGKWWRQNCGN